MTTIWNNFLVVVGRYTIQFYSIPSADNPPELQHSLLVTHPLFEAQRINLHKTSLEFIAHSREKTVVRIIVDMQRNAPTVRVHNGISEKIHQGSVYQLQVGVTGRRSIWFYDESASRLPRLPLAVQCANLKPNSTSLDITGDFTHLPTISAFPKIHFDEALGMLVIGNIFGELAICNFFAAQPAEIWSMTKDLFPSESQPRSLAISVRFYVSYFPFLTFKTGSQRAEHTRMGIPDIIDEYICALC